MLTLERSDDILTILRRDKKATVSQLSQSLYVSEATVRRDLSRMESLGLVRRCFGGVMLCQSEHDEPSAQLRHNINLKEKRRIAELARPLLENDKTYFFDGSTTVGMLAALMQTLSRVTVMTNGLNNALRLAECRGVNAILSGGKVDSGADAALGASTVAFFQRLRADAVFFSCNGLDESGAYDTTIEQSTVKQTLLEGARKRILLADKSKFGRPAAVRTAALAEVDAIYTDCKPSAAFLSAAIQAECKVYWPQSTDSLQ